MNNKTLVIVVLLALLAIVFTSCAGNKQLVKDNETLTSDLNAARARISDLEGQIKTKDQQVQDLEMQITSKDEEISNLQSELAQSEQDARELEIQIVSREEEIAALEESMSTLQMGGGDESAVIAQLNNRKNALENQVESLQSKLDEANTRNGELEAEIETLNADRRGLEEELAELRSREDKDRARMSMTRDELVRSLEEEIDEKTVAIQQYKDALTINIVDKLFFDSGKADIKKSGLSILDRIAEAVKGLEDKIIRIEGHTDDVPIGPKIKGKYPSNWELGAARSSAVTRYFIDKHGIEPSRIMAISYSKYRPVVPNISEEYRARNRRIEIVLTERALYELMEIEESSSTED